MRIGRISRRKVLIAFMAAMLLMVSLTACGSQSSGSSEVSTESGELADVVEDGSSANDISTTNDINIGSKNDGGRGNGSKGDMRGMGGNMGGTSSHSGVGTTELSDGWVSSVYSYTDGSGSPAELEYAIYVPGSYDGSEALPLVTYVGDATYVGSGVAAFAAGECPSNWITDANMEKYPCFFLVIGFTESATDLTEGSQGAQVVDIIDLVAEEYGIDTNRLYLTGQSMGGILDFALNASYPQKFAATVYVGCQPGENVGDEQYNGSIASIDYASQTFVYIASALDPKAPFGQAAIMESLDDKGVSYAVLTDMDYQDIEKTNTDVATVLAEGCAQNFLQFTTVTNSGSSAEEHMESFEYGYEINAVYEWLMQQSLD